MNGKAALHQMEKGCIVEKYERFYMFHKGRIFYSDDSKDWKESTMTPEQFSSLELGWNLVK